MIPRKHKQNPSFLCSTGLCQRKGMGKPFYSSYVTTCYLHTGSGNPASINSTVPVMASNSPRNCEEAMRTIIRIGTVHHKFRALGKRSSHGRTSAGRHIAVGARSMHSYTGWTVILPRMYAVTSTIATWAANRVCMMSCCLNEYHHVHKVDM